MNVLSVSSGRADIGILTPVWRALAANDAVTLHVLLTGAHVTDDSAARRALPPRGVAHTAGADIAGRSGAGATNAMAHIADAAGQLAARLIPDRVLLIGDRLDMLPAALGLVPLNMPLVHLHGGELTYGAADERARHAMTKLSHLHCTATAEAASRVAQMGEEAWRIFVTGAPGLDSLREAPQMSAAEFAAAMGLASIEGLRLVTVHPETNAADPLAALDAALDALDAAPGPALITAPNADPGAIEARGRIDAFLRRHRRAMFHETLGATLYANALRHAAVMIGNSSSGLLEAGLFGLPVINIGARQAGRQRGANVRDCPADAASVVELLRDLPTRFASGTPYGDGHAGIRVASVITAAHDTNRLLYKQFATDVPHFAAPWDAPAEQLRQA